MAAGGLLLSLAITLAMRDRTWAGTQWSAFGADVCVLGLLISMSLRTDRYWPLSAAGFQLLCVATHVARIVDPGVHAWAYATGQVIWSQLVFVALGVGVWGTWRERFYPAAIDAPITDPGATRR